MENSELTKIRTELESEYGEDIEYVKDVSEEENVREPADIVFKTSMREINNYAYGQQFKPIKLPEAVSEEYEILGMEIVGIGVDMWRKYTVDSIVYLKER